MIFNRPNNFIFLFCIVCMPFVSFSWGFFAHKEINRLAVFTLPIEMVVFYKTNIHYLIERSVQPDKRRYSMKEEACRHYIDLDAYPDSLKKKMPSRWTDAIKIFKEDSLMLHGTVPWHIQLMKYLLTEAFLKKDKQQILKLSAEIGHYVGDANVPLHTTKNYNGQFTNQVGIHGFWESRLPELFSTDYDFFTGRAAYIPNIEKRIWDDIYNAHRALDSVLTFEKKLGEHFSPDKKYSFEERNNITIKVYSEDYSKAYHKYLNHQVERQMRESIKLLGDIWYTCWVDGGQPELDNFSLLPDTTSIKDDTEGKLLSEDCAH